MEFAKERARPWRQRDEPHLHEDEELEQVHEVPQVLYPQIEEALKDEHAGGDSSQGRGNILTHRLNLFDFRLSVLWLNFR